MSGELDGRTIIVTGASRGIGRALAVGLAARGAAVVCAARTVTADPAGLPGTIHATVAAIEQAGGRALIVLAKLVEPPMRAQGGGSIINISSKSSPSSRVASSVFTAPGRSAFTQIPRSTSSGASAVVNRSIAALATE